MIGIAFTVMCLIFGTTFLAIKVGVEAGLPPFLSAGVRFFAAGAILFIAMKLTGKVRWSLLWRKEMLLIEQERPSVHFQPCIGQSNMSARGSELFCQLPGR